MDEKTLYSEAKKILKECGWTQGVGQDMDGRRCLVNALDHAYYKLVDSGYDNVPTIVDVLEPVDEFLGQDTVDWNDDPDRTWEEVETVLGQLHEKELANRA
jgi:hypothetical protein